MDKEMAAILRLQDAAEMSEKLYKKPLLITYSGGKDSDVLVHLAKVAGIDFEVNHSLTTADAPETVRHIREVFHQLENEGVNCDIDVHRHPDGKVDTMWNLIPRKGMPPTRFARYCCAALKETGGKGRFIAMGIRWAESTRRSDRSAFEIIHVKKKEDRISIMSMDNEEDRQAFESCPIKGERAVSPIIDWTNKDIWDYIRAEKIETNPLYECGFNRVGCIGCPMATPKQRYHEFTVWPIYKQNYIRAFDRLLKELHRKGTVVRAWETVEDVFHWWMDDGIIPGQIGIDDEQSS